MDPYLVLGVPRDADDKVIKKAYRSLAQKYHPDKKDGDDAMFKQVQKSYEILSNPERRAKYDATGVTAEDGNIREKAMEGAAHLLSEAINRVDVEKTNIYEIAREKIAETKRTIENELAKTHKGIKDRQEAINRTSHKNGESLVIEFISADIRRMEETKRQQEFGLRVVAEVTAILEGYEYKTDPPDRYSETSLANMQRTTFSGGWSRS